MPEDTLQGFGLNARKALRQGMHFGDHHDFGQFHRDGIAYTHTVALQYLVLEHAGIGFRYGGIGKDAETGIDTIHGCLLTHDLGNLLFAGPDFPDDSR